MGFIERFRVECLRSVLINTDMAEAAYKAGADRYFFSSSACAYNTSLQNDPNVRALKEADFDLYRTAIESAEAVILNFNLPIKAAVAVEEATVYCTSKARGLL